jgi:hypothetical protein
MDAMVEEVVTLRSDPKKCWRCHGHGWFFLLPSGFSPFEAPITTTARVAQKFACPQCWAGERMARIGHLPRAEAV